MRKKDLIRENNKLRLDIEILNQRIWQYKEACKNIRDTYGAEILKLENERLLKYHPNITAKSIEWYPPEIDRFVFSVNKKYNFRYEIKGEE